jgi:hypothetical protein
MASVKEIEVVQNTNLVNALIAVEKYSPEEAIATILASMKAGMSVEQIAHCEKLVKERDNK